MALVKAKGNMYEWVTHTWSILQGKCPHDCDYCYVKTGMIGKYPSLKVQYEGVPRLNERDRNINLGKGKTIFVAHTSDLFAKDIPLGLIEQVLDICKKYPENKYVFQTKAPEHMLILAHLGYLPPKEMVELGTTIETDDWDMLKKHTKAGSPTARLYAMSRLHQEGYKTFITIEPVMKFTHDFADKIIDARPDFVNIGADSKKCSLPEPTWEEVVDLKERIEKAGIEIRIKTNLERLKI